MIEETESQAAQVSRVRDAVGLALTTQGGQHGIQVVNQVKQDEKSNLDADQAEEKNLIAWEMDGVKGHDGHHGAEAPTAGV